MGGDTGIARRSGAEAFLGPEFGDGIWNAIRNDRLFTVPNLLSLLRLVGVPLFLWLLLGPQYDMLALLVLVFSGITDWLDGKIARWLDQSSALGALLDPSVDRLYILSTLIAFMIRGIVPWWLVAVLVAREIVLVAALLMLRHHGFGPPQVHYLGKAATFTLLYAFPLLLLAEGDSAFAAIASPFGLAFTAWGCLLYLWSGALYLIQFGGAVRRLRGATPGAAAA
ncbi:cardiolipin synthase [Actinoalloteichus hoggarensis]|uniref:Putative CDP-diacylglycerol--glycerol-3-phosphate 3-phosphatidyl-transferase 2 n=1 Tax=Actinoalloteichus hoggarensis TaxID=1470176 RepID=A0A221W1Y2_9PSEU|nr:Putative CDP-diacylglycerol--glycerol-3-phosphate 3-phosphatidyl-transferase 2 [Actinoalloteichus hoggarensis]MBB5919509.1 cardiolipin synthase [Actinoalloteichus hoggarensis]